MHWVLVSTHKWLLVYTSGELLNWLGATDELLDSCIYTYDSIID